MAPFVPVADIVHALDNSGSVVVDVRPMAAYNGWPLKHEGRGGHITGAVPFPVAWFSASDGDERISLLKNKGITPDKSLILYGYDSDDAATAASYLAELGYGSVRVFKDGLRAWAADPGNP